MIEEEREESERGNTTLECYATIDFSRTYANSLISLNSADLSMAKAFKISQTAQTARLQSPKMYNFQTSMLETGFTRKQKERRSGA